MAAPLEILAGVVADALASPPSSPATPVSPPPSAGSASGVPDDKRAARAERNRQSAAASRERKKRHVRDLETRVASFSAAAAAASAAAAAAAAEIAALRADNARLRSVLGKRPRADAPDPGPPLQLPRPLRARSPSERSTSCTTRTTGSPVGVGGSNVVCQGVSVYGVMEPVFSTRRGPRPLLPHLRPW